MDLLFWVTLFVVLGALAGNYLGIMGYIREASIPVWKFFEGVGDKIVGWTVPDHYGIYADDCSQSGASVEAGASVCVWLEHAFAK